MSLELAYFYGSEAEQYSFYRIPKVLLTDQRYRGVSMEAKVLYGLMLDRMGLSVRLSCDTSAMLPVIEQATAYLREAGVAPFRFWAYVLVQDVADAHQRVLALEGMGVTAFAQPYRDYDSGEPSGEQRAFARWVNVRSIHKSCTWENYNDARRRPRNGR